MARAWAWGLGVLIVWLGSMGVAFWLPERRLANEIAAARRDGLWTEWQDVQHDAERVPEKDNAAPMIERAVAIEKAAANKAWDEAARHLLKGTVKASEVALLRKGLAAHPEAIAAWRAASSRPKVNYHRRWKDGPAVLFPEFADLKRGVRRLAVASHLGQEPRANLLAAAHLAHVTRQEPVIIAPLVSVAMGRIALREARRQGLAREVDAVLGPPIDVRRMYAAELPFALDVMQNEGKVEWYRRMGVKEDPPFWYRFNHGSVSRANETYEVLHAWRALWRDLPQDGTDYPRAARAMRLHLGGIEERLANWSVIYEKLGYEPGDETKAVEALQKYEAERKTVR